MAQNTDASTKAEQWLDPLTEPLTQAKDTRFAPTWFSPPDSTQQDRNSHLAAQVRLPSLLWQQLMRARVIVATVLLLLQVFIISHGGQKVWPLGVCLAYQVATAAVLRWARPSQADSIWSPRWAMTLWMDIGVFSLLHLFQHGGINFTPLFALPVLLAAILGPLLLALGSAACATLVLLAEAWQSTRAFPDLSTTLYLQASLTGLGFFMVALLASQLTVRLIREQTQALRNQILARTESEISTLIVNGLNEGVLVLNAQGKLWHANPAVCAMLDAPDTTLNGLQQSTGWPLMAAWLQTCQSQGRDCESEIAIPTRTGPHRKLRLRARLVVPQARQRMEQACVVFLEDLRDVEARVQTEKLATMGRLTAAVAHEIRNPLAAIAQANALLAEDDLAPAHHRLVTMIGQNAKRLGRTVDDILDSVRSGHHAHTTAACTCDLTEQIPIMVADWSRITSQCSVEVQHPAKPLHVRFDEEHLRRVLCNLLDNAHKHSPASATVQVLVAVTESGMALLRVWNAGPALPADVQSHLFEPFSSSNSRSSGLGLYICQTLCQSHQANISYARLQVGGQEGHAFSVQLPAA